MSKKWLGFWILAAILFWVILYFTLIPKPPAPVVIPGKPIIRIDSVVVHDTTILSIPRDSIVVRKLPKDTTIKPDTTTGADTGGACYGVEKALESGGFMAAEVCSRYFPVKKPIDLRFNLSYKRGDDTLKTILRTDTLKIKPPVTSTVIEILIGFIVGGVVAIWALH
jgi:hypothetical protein